MAYNRNDFLNCLRELRFQDALSMMLTQGDTSSAELTSEANADIQSCQSPTLLNDVAELKELNEFLRIFENNKYQGVEKVKEPSALNDVAKLNELPIKLNNNKDEAIEKPNEISELNSVNKFNELLIKPATNQDGTIEKAANMLFYLKRVLTLIIQNAGEARYALDDRFGQTAFMKPYVRGHHALAKALISVLSDSNLKQGEKFRVAYTTDRRGETLLNSAIKVCDFYSIGNLLSFDNDEHKLFFLRNSKGWYGLAYALKCYHDRPSDLTMSIFNQLYFGLPKNSGTRYPKKEFRSKAVEKKIKFEDWGVTSKYLWQYALRYCAKRNEDGSVRGMDMMMVDVVAKAIEEGIVVMGIPVDLSLAIDYSESYSGTPGRYLSEAFEKRQSGLARRTLAQTWVNPALQKNAEFVAQITPDQAAAASSGSSGVRRIIQSHTRPRTMGMSLFTRRSALSALDTPSSGEQGQDRVETKVSSVKPGNGGKPHDNL